MLDWKLFILSLGWHHVAELQEDLAVDASLRLAISKPQDLCTCTCSGFCHHHTLQAAVAAAEATASSATVPDAHVATRFAHVSFMFVGKSNC